MDDIVLGTRSAWTPSFYGYDGGGSVRLLTDATGTVTDTYDYDAWGNAINATGATPKLYLYRGEQYRRRPESVLYSGQIRQSAAREISIARPRRNRRYKSGHLAEIPIRERQSDQSC